VDESGARRTSRLNEPQGAAAERYHSECWSAPTR